MSLKSDYERKIEAQLNQWDAEINLLKAKALNAKTDIKINYHKELEELKLKKELVIKRLEELKTSGTELFEELKDSVEKACTEFKHGFNSTHSHFK